MPKAHLTITGKTGPLAEFIKDHAGHLINTNYSFFGVAVPLPRKHWGIAEEAIEAWGCSNQPYVKVLSEKKPLEQPKDFSLDEIVYELTWALPVFPPNRWLEQASALYGLQMLLEFTDGDRITILECNSKGEVVLDKELEKVAADEFYDLQHRLHGSSRIYRPVTEKDLKAYINDLRLYDGYTIDNLATVLIDALTEQELQLTLHKYADIVRLRDREETAARLQKQRENDPYYILRAKKDKSLETVDARIKEARDKGELQAAAGIAATHHDLMWESVVGDGAFGHFGGLTKDFKGLATDLYNIYPDLRPFFPRVMLLGGLDREVKFRDAYKKVVKNAKDRERKSAKRLQEAEAALKAAESPKINLFDGIDYDSNLNNLLSAEAESLKGDK